MDNHVLSTFVCHDKFLCSDASKANCFPDFWNISFSGSFVSELELLQHNIGLCQQLIVANALEKNFCGKEQSFVEAAFTTNQHVGLVWITYE